jgi:uncharacterized protein YdhG (YjbR/CyaY superfamily)
MQSTANTVEEYLEGLPEDKKTAMAELRKTITTNLPPGFTEVITYGMISYVVPHSIYPNGYHCDPKQPLSFISIASQKNYVALYHMGIYASPSLLSWFKEEYSKTSKTKPDMGKSCIRFKKPEQIPFALIGSLASKITPHEWINIYESAIKGTRK